MANAVKLTYDKGTGVFTAKVTPDNSTPDGAVLLRLLDPTGQQMSPSPPALPPDNKYTYPWANAPADSYFVTASFTTGNTATDKLELTKDGKKTKTE